MQTYIQQFFHWVNQSYIFGLPIDHFMHVAACFFLFSGFRYWLKRKISVSFFLIFCIGMAKVWYSWGSMIHNGRYENPVEKMFDNFLGAFLAFYFIEPLVFKSKHASNTSIVKQKL